MNKRLIFLSLAFSILLIGIVSASNYGYSKSYTVKESYDSYGYSYYEKNSAKTPWGETTTYKQVKDYDTIPSYYVGDRSPYKNPVSTYWKDGPFHGYSNTYKVISDYDVPNTYNTNYVDYHYSDSYNRARTGSQYYNYYYTAPKVYTSNGGMYWDHGYNGYECGNGFYCWNN